MTCYLDPTTLGRVELETIEPRKFEFDFGENVTFRCKAGFAYALNMMQKTATMQCLSVPESPTQGVWIPGPSQVCRGRSVEE